MLLPHALRLPVQPVSGCTARAVALSPAGHDHHTGPVLAATGLGIYISLNSAGGVGPPLGSSPTLTVPGPLTLRRAAPVRTTASPHLLSLLLIKERTPSPMGA